MRARGANPIGRSQGGGGLPKPPFLGVSGATNAACFTSMHACTGDPIWQGKLRVLRVRKGASFRHALFFTRTLTYPHPYSTPRSRNRNGT